MAGIRNANLIGHLWPLCKTCGHIAQSHDKAGCSESVRCHHCGAHDSRVRCACKEYNGPTLEQFMETKLTQEERDYYGKMWGV